MKNLAVIAAAVCFGAAVAYFGRSLS